jgi:xanthine/CO dehydrogenase XdhC/CoxF family maturation factor
MSIFDVIVEFLKQKDNFAIAIIIDRNESASLSVGIRMLIYRDKTAIGTINGGGEVKELLLAAAVLSDQTSIVKQLMLRVRTKITLHFRTLLSGCLNAYNLRIYFCADPK